MAPLYRQFLKEGKRVAISDLAPGDVHVLGMPAQLEAFVNVPAPALD